MTTYKVQIIVTVTDAQMDNEYEWESVANRVRNRILRSARKPLDRDARLRIQSVAIDTASEDIDEEGDVGPF